MKMTNMAKMLAAKKGKKKPQMMMKKKDMPMKKGM